MIGWLKKLIKETAVKEVAEKFKQFDRFMEVFDPEAATNIHITNEDNSDQIDMIKGTLKELGVEYRDLEKRIRNLEKNA